MKNILNNIWLIFIWLSLLNAWSAKINSKYYVAQNPELRPGYKKIISEWLIFSNIPWLIMAIGNLSDSTLQFSDYMRLFTLNPFVLAFHISIILIWLLCVYWIFFKKGADFLVKHPGLINIYGRGLKRKKMTSMDVKLFFAIFLITAFLALAALWNTDLDLQNLIKLKR